MANALLWVAKLIPARVLFFTRFGLWFQDILWRHACPRPLIDDPSARACVLAGKCGCDNQSRYGTGKETKA